MWGLDLGRSRRRIVNDFVAAKATTAARAIAYGEADRRNFRRLCGYGVIVDDGAGRYHLDAHKLGLFRGAIRRRIAAIVATLGVVASAGVAATVLALAE